MSQGRQPSESQSRQLTGSHPMVTKGPVYMTVSQLIVQLINEVLNDNDYLPLILSDRNGLYAITAVKKSRVNMPIDPLTQFLLFHNGQVMTVKINNANPHQAPSQRFNSNKDTLKNQLIENIEALRQGKFAVLIIHRANNVDYEFPQIITESINIEFDPVIKDL